METRAVHLYPCICWFPRANFANQFRVERWLFLTVDSNVSNERFFEPISLRFSFSLSPSRQFRWHHLFNFSFLHFRFFYFVFIRDHISRRWCRRCSGALCTHVPQVFRSFSSTIPSAACWTGTHTHNLSLVLRYNIPFRCCFIYVSVAHDWWPGVWVWVSAACTL